MAAGDKAPLTAPAVVWAQRTDKVYLTINLEDCKDPVIELSESQLHFKGKGGPHQEEHEVTMEFYGELDTAKSKYVVQSRNIPMVLVRKEEGPYWPHLLKVKGKVHWLKTDFEKWKDEDESEDEEPGMGGMGGMGMPGMGGMGMPGMGGMGGMGMPGMGGPGGMDLSQMMSQMGGGFDGGDIPADGDAGDEEPDSDDEELPDLE